MFHNVFQFYQDVIDGKESQQSWFSEMVNSGKPVTHFKISNPEDVKKGEKPTSKEVAVTYEHTNEEGDQMSFGEYCDYFIRERSKKLLNDVELLLNEKPIEEMAKLIQQLLFGIDFYIEKIMGLNYNENYEFVAKDLQSIKPDLEKLCAFHASINKLPIPHNVSHSIADDKKDKPTNPKFQWKGKTNVLATFFYDLITGQDKNDALLIADKSLIKRFLLENFLDAEGNPLSDATVTTIFTPSKEEKRANRGDRIELGNVKPK